MDKKGQKGFVFGILISLTIIILIIIPVLWLGYGQITKKSTGELVEASIGIKLLFTAVGAFFLIFGWWNYFRQKKIDKSKLTSNNKAMSTVYKASGYYGRIKATNTGIVSGILLIISIVIFAGVGEGSTIPRITLGFLLLGFAILGFIYSWILWWRSKSLVKGRFY